MHQHHRELEGHGWLDVEQAAKLLGKEVQTIANWRSQGKGPKYTKSGGTVRYRREWIAEYVYSGVVDPRQQNEVTTAPCETSKPKAKGSGRRNRKSNGPEANSTTASKPRGRTRKFGGHQAKRKKLEAA